MSKQGDGAMNGAKFPFGEKATLLRTSSNDKLVIKPSTKRFQPGKKSTNLVLKQMGDNGVLQKRTIYGSGSSNNGLQPEKHNDP